MIGDSSGLNITHTGCLRLLSKSLSFLLTDVLCVPNMTQNLISVSKFCVSNQVAVEFLSFSLVVKDLRTGARLMQGRTRNGVYEWLSHARPETPPIIAFFSVKASILDWDHRLGHPSSRIISKLMSSQALSIVSSNKSSNSCSACQINKTHKLPFSISFVLSFKPLEVIYLDV